ncbi:MAG: hypothetical protein IPL21_14345 [Saprospirales bacterium]|nr:hypothetical protein [Saprospirales bacterium]
MNNGCVALCGVSGTNNVFYKLDANGNIVFSKLYTNPQGNFFFKKIKQTQTGGFSIASLRHNYSHRELISAFEYLYYYNSDYTVGCIDSIGNVLWNKNAATVVTKSLFETKYDQLEYYINYDFHHC